MGRADQCQSDILEVFSQIETVDLGPPEIPRGWVAKNVAIDQDQKVSHQLMTAFQINIIKFEERTS